MLRQNHAQGLGNPQWRINVLMMAESALAAEDRGIGSVESVILGIWEVHGGGQLVVPSARLWG